MFIVFQHEKQLLPELSEAPEGSFWGHIYIIGSFTNDHSSNYALTVIEDRASRFII
jgi:hypothetical protein